MSFISIHKYKNIVLIRPECLETNSEKLVKNDILTLIGIKDKRFSDFELRTKIRNFEIF